MRANHYSAAELAELLKRASFGHGTGEHVDACEQCHMLAALVSRAQGAPSDEEGEVTMDALKRWALSR